MGKVVDNEVPVVSSEPEVPAVVTPSEAVQSVPVVVGNRTVVEVPVDVNVSAAVVVPNVTQD